MILTSGHVKMRTPRGLWKVNNREDAAAFPEYSPASLKQSSGLCPAPFPHVRGLGKKSDIDWAKSQTALAAATYHVMERNPYGLFIL